MTTRNIILVIALFTASAVAGFMFNESSRQRAVTTVVEQPDTAGHVRELFSLPDVDGNDRSIAEWDGKAMVVNFWATWCPPCLREIPLLIEMQDEASRRGVQIIGIAVDDPVAVREFAAKTAFNYPILMGEQDALDAAAAFGTEIVGLPMTVLTDRNGRVVEVHAGEITHDALSAAIARLGR